MASLGADVVCTESGSSGKSSVLKTGGIKCLECKQNYGKPGPDSLWPRTRQGHGRKKDWKEKWEVVGLSRGHVWRA